jgi:energy-coupling factor transporter transmembrane protein EcfT
MKLLSNIFCYLAVGCFVVLALFVVASIWGNFNREIISKIGGTITVALFLFWILSSIANEADKN